MEVIANSETLSDFLKKIIDNSNEWVIVSGDSEGNNGLIFRPIENENAFAYSGCTLRNPSAFDISRKQLKKLRKFLIAIPLQPILIEFAQEEIKCKKMIVEF